MANMEIEGSRISDSARRVLMAVIENRIHSVVDRTYYLIPKHLMENGVLKKGVTAQMNLNRAVDFIHKKEVVASVEGIVLSQEDAELIRGFLE